MKTKKLLLFGLRNHTEEFVSTRHNVGFAFVVKLLSVSSTEAFNKNLSFGNVVNLNFKGDIERICFPAFINQSGASLKKVWPEIVQENYQILICCDDTSLALGEYSFSNSPQPKSHNGIKNIMQHFPQNDFWFLNIGVGQNKPMKEWVLGELTKNETAILNAVFQNLKEKLYRGWNSITEEHCFQESDYERMKKILANSSLSSWMTITGGQFGDEGKGKIVDFLASKNLFSNICRFSGGPNAGHTVWVEGQKHQLSMLPVGALQKNKNVVLGSGCLISLPILLKELKIMKKINPSFQLFISQKAHLIMPYHVAWDKWEESTKEQQIGTTCRGIGPCMQDKVSRIGFMIGELSNQKAFETKLKKVLSLKNLIWTKIQQQKSFAFKTIANDLFQDFAVIANSVVNIYDWAKKHKNENFLFEGAQGTLLDLTFGFYPFVTSTPTSSLAAQFGLEHAPLATKTKHLGVFKSYVTRVGSGPLPGIMPAKTMTIISNLGHEVGTVTGRGRHIAWFDAPAARYAVAVNNYSEIALTCLDVFSHLEELEIIEYFEINGEKTYAPIFDAAQWPQMKIHTKKLKGWKKPISHIRHFVDLPVEAQIYVKNLEKLIGCPITYISVGPERNQMIVR